MGLKNRLKERRAALGVNQQELGRMAGVSRQTISLIERGDYSPSVTLALTLAKICGVAVEDIFILEEENDESSNDPIKQENKKALPRFILIMVASLVLGVALGWGLVKLSLEDFGDTLAAAGLFFTGRIAPVLLYALPILELAVCLPIYFGAKRRMADWDGEDEGVSNEIEAKLSVCMWATSMATILDLLLLGVLASGFVNSVGTPLDVGPAAFFARLAVFLGALFLNMIFQQKLVDTIKKLNPEKQGSVYDTKFHKKWLESCDEAERAVIGQCAYKAYMAMARACMTLWVVFALGGMFFEWGFLPVLAVCAIWGVGQTVYSYWCLKLSNPGVMM